MKLASLRNGTRDGRLVVVSRDLTRAIGCEEVAQTLQAALENWDRTAPLLDELYVDLNMNRARASFPFDPQDALPPLPRAYQWLDGSVYKSHARLLQRAFNVDPSIHPEGVPLMYQGASDDFIGPMDDLPLPNVADNIDFEAEVAVVLDDVPMGTSAADAASHVKLLMLVNDVSLRRYIVTEMRSGFGFLQAKPSSSFSPIAVTPDELGESWNDARVDLPLHVEWNGRWFGHPNAAAMEYGFDQLIEFASRARRLRAGTIIGSGTVSNDDRSVGSACIAERRAIEIIEFGQPRTDFMKFGDRVRIWMNDREGRSIFGAIDQQVVSA